MDNRENKQHMVKVKRCDIHIIVILERDDNYEAE